MAYGELRRVADGNLVSTRTGKEKAGNPYGLWALPRDQHGCDSSVIGEWEPLFTKFRTECYSGGSAAGVDRSLGLCVKRRNPEAREARGRISIKQGNKRLRRWIKKYGLRESRGKRLFKIVLRGVGMVCAKMKNLSGNLRLPLDKGTHRSAAIYRSL